MKGARRSKDFDFVQANVRTGLDLRSIDELLSKCGCISNYFLWPGAKHTPERVRIICVANKLQLILKRNNLTAQRTPPELLIFSLSVGERRRQANSNTERGREKKKC